MTAAQISQLITLAISVGGGLTAYLYALAARRHAQNAQNIAAQVFHAPQSPPEVPQQRGSDASPS